MTRAALAHFDRRFTLILEGRTSLDVPAVPDRAERVRQIYGGAVADRLVRFSLTSGPYRASGFTSRPDFTRSTTRDQRLFVNGRPIRDRGLLRAIAEAYHTLLPARRFPFVILFLEVPPERVDVNVHPAKWEVRFAEGRLLFDLTRRAIRGALADQRPVPALSLSVLPDSPPAPEDSVRTAPVPAVGERTEEWRFAPEVPGEAARTAPLPTAAARLTPLAQYRDSYILAADEEGLAIVDQHVAHERVLYEKLLKEAGRERVERQSLLFPRTMEVDPLLDRRLSAGAESLGRLGLALERFGEGAWVIREVPALLGPADPAALVQDLAEELGRGGEGESWDRLQHRLAATTACHAAVKVNFPLTVEKMAFLLDELARTDNPMTCPHGRPIILRLTHLELEKSFRRR
jgi:DNA mismatch repair protein MutL